MNNSLRATSASPLVERRMCLALKAQHSPQAWGIAPGFMVSRTPALKARIISSAIEARFQRFFYAAI